MERIQTRIHASWTFLYEKLQQLETGGVPHARCNKYFNVTVKFAGCSRHFDWLLLGLGGTQEEPELHLRTSTVYQIDTNKIGDYTNEMEYMVYFPQESAVCVDAEVVKYIRRKVEQMYVQGLAADILNPERDIMFSDVTVDTGQLLVTLTETALSELEQENVLRQEGGTRNKKRRDRRRSRSRKAVSRSHQADPPSAQGGGAATA